MLFNTTSSDILEKEVGRRQAENFSKSVKNLPSECNYVTKTMWENSHNCNII
jgi:hypothetical protein